MAIHRDIEFTIMPNQINEGGLVRCVARIRIVVVLGEADVDIAT
jgi:hypothetical protein